MPLKKNMMKKNLENLPLKERINYGYRKVITMMLISGLFSIVVMGILFANMLHYLQNVTVADQAVKICRINVNAAARNIREMALNNDTSSYDDYEQTVESLLTEVDTQLQNLKKSGVVPDADCEEYSSTLKDWGNIGYSIMNEIKSGDKDNAVDSIMNDCTPALNKAVKIATRLDEMTDKQSSQSARITIIFAMAGIACIIVCLILAWKLTAKTGKKACAESNLAWDSWQNTSLEYSILNVWMKDDSPSNIKALGHRRWILSPEMKKTGFGAVSGSRGTYACMYVFDFSRKVKKNYQVAWPAQQMPVSYFPEGTPWSLSLGKMLKAEKITVTLTRVSDGTIWRFSKKAADGDFYISNEAYGQEGCIIFNPKGIGRCNAGDRFRVNITGAGKEICYEVNFF